jgi:hypothetical protein
MATQGKWSSFGLWVFGSNAHKVLMEGSTPLLLIRPYKRGERKRSEIEPANK